MIDFIHEQDAETLLHVAFEATNVKFDRVELRSRQEDGNRV